MPPRTATFRAAMMRQTTIAGGRRRSPTISRKAIARELRAATAARDPELAQAIEELEAARPRTRADCEGGIRPCPFFSCRYNLACDVTRGGGVRWTFAGRELEELPATCALDVAAEGARTLEAVAVLCNVTRERVRQIEGRAVEKMKRAAERGSLEVPEPRPDPETHRPW